MHDWSRSVPAKANKPRLLRLTVRAYEDRPLVPGGSNPVEGEATAIRVARAQRARF
jgi:hypothetical protein